MAGYYIYFSSSLPMLLFGAAPPFSSEKFFRMCRGMISDKDINLLKRAVQVDGRYDEKIPVTLRKWRAFDIALRNELVKIRASRRKQDPQKYMRCEGYTDPSITHIALQAYRTPSPIEAERVLDRERWRVLDELSIGHYFDIDFLMIYAVKLLMLERWNRIDKADPAALLDKASAA